MFLAFLEAPLGGPETINSRSKENVGPEVAVRISPGLIHRGVSETVKVLIVRKGQCSRGAEP